MQKRSTKLKTEKKRQRKIRGTHMKTPTYRTFFPIGQSPRQMFCCYVCAHFFFAAIITEGERKERLTI